MGRKVEICSKLVSKNYYFEKKLNEIGLTENYLAFFYLVDIMDILINETKIVRSFSTEVYPKLAKKYNKSMCTIERDIRNVINVLWDDGMKYKLSNYFNKTDKPKCCEFIYLIKNYILHTIT